MENRFRSGTAYERWDQKNRNKGIANYFEEEREGSYLKDLKGRIQNNLSGILRLVITALLVLVQVLLVLYLPFLLQSVTVYFYFVLEICSVIAIVTLVNKNQSPSFRIAWISIVMLLPVSGFIFYAFWGRETKKNHRKG